MECNDDEIVWEIEQGGGSDFEPETDMESKRLRHPLFRKGAWVVFALACVGLAILTGVWIHSGGLAGSTPAALAPIRSIVQDVPVQIMIDVKGDVRHPGVYRLSDQSRIQDAVRAAGGYIHAEDRAMVNEAAPLDDGMELVIAAPRQLDHAAPGNVVDSAASHLSEHSKPAQEALSLSAHSTNVDLNTASSATLETIPGIGPKRADAILAYRSQHGGFSSVDELRNIRGIGQALFHRLATHVVVTSAHGHKP